MSYRIRLADLEARQNCVAAMSARVFVPIFCLVGRVSRSLVARLRQLATAALIAAATAMAWSHGLRGELRRRHRRCGMSLERAAGYVASGAEGGRLSPDLSAVARTMWASITTSVGPPIIIKCSALSRRIKTS